VIRLLIVIICVAYTISPIDLIPDVVPVIGWLDDAGIDVVGVVIFWLLGPANNQNEEY
jgi:uncharacterized membrane protein YkvA (DUF1232 family)